MVSPIMIAAAAALFMLGLFVEALWFRALHDDPPATYCLYAVRDKLVRLVAEKKIAANDPSFQALYKNITILLRATRCISGPDGWNLAELQGKALARREIFSTRLEELPTSGRPPALEDVMNDLRKALGHLIQNHFGIFVQIDAKRREARCIQREQAKRLLQMIHQNHGQRSAAS